jgi:hypothetical protein
MHQRHIDQADDLRTRTLEIHVETLGLLVLKIT